MREYYKELKPKDRINMVMNEYVEPYISEFGFKYFPSVMSFKKKHAEFTYRLELVSNHRNQTGIWCGFKAHAYIIAHNYSKWHKKQYGQNIDYAIIIDEEDQKISGYDLSGYMSGPMHVRVEVENTQTEPELMNVVMGYNLATDDNQEIVESFINNFKNAVLPYFNKLTNYMEAIDAVIEEGYYFKAPMLMDFCEMLGNEEKANQVYEWFENENKENGNFPEEMLEKMTVRLNRLKNGYNE